MMAQPQQPALIPVILTRPEGQSWATAQALPTGCRPVISPLLEIVQLPITNAPDPSATLIFTSANGVGALSVFPPTEAQRAVCVGEATARAAAAAGYAAQVCGQDADGLVRLLSDGWPRTTLVHVRGRHARGDVAGRLSAAGHSVSEIVAYDQVPKPLTDEALSALLSGRSLVPLFSPRTAALFVAACPEAPQAELLCLSAAVAERASEGHYAALWTAPEPTLAAILDEVSCRVGRKTLEGGEGGG